MAKAPELLQEFIAALDVVSDHVGVNLGETVESLVMKGSGASEAVWLSLTNVMRVVEQLEFQKFTTLTVDDKLVSFSEMKKDFGAIVLIRDWKLVFSKRACWKECTFTEKNLHPLFFIDITQFNRWISTVNPFGENGFPFSDEKSLLLLVPNRFSAFGGPRIVVSPTEKIDLAVGEKECLTEVEVGLPDEESIRRHAHLMPSNPMALSPSRFSLTWGDFSSDLALAFRRFSAATLAACLADVVYDTDRVVVKGLRHLELKVFDSEEHVPVEALNTLKKAVAWVYEERVDTRKRLLTDRLSIDALDSHTFVDTICESINRAFSQARDEYSFVILDRKDQYAKEVREFLGDLQAQAQLYASKTRSLIDGLLRDALAAFVFTGLALSLRVGSRLELDLSANANTFFKALAVYFATSGGLQLAAAIRDLKTSENEFRRWARITQEYISTEKLVAWCEEDLAPRRRSFWVFAVFTCLLYILLTMAAFNIDAVVSWANVGIAGTS